MRRARDEARKALTSKSDFLANMSHEIRTPMTAILGFADLLEGDESVRNDPRRADDAIRTIKSNADHLLNVVNDILDVSKIEAGRMTVERRDVDPAEIIEGAIELLRPIAEGKGITLVSSWLTLAPATIRTDPTRLRQILHNVISNAIKFTELGGVTVLATCDPASQTLTIKIQDTGIGMTVHELARVSEFKPFNQADSSMTRRFGGTGLGLCISASFARLLGGKIAVESDYGRGSTFTITLKTGPLDETRMVNEQEPRTGQSISRSSPASANEKPLAGARILLAEDGPDNQRLITYHLKKAGAEVEVADNGLIAAEKLERSMNNPRSLPDLVLMDMQMPELDGYSATERLRKAGLELPIIALTAHAMEGDREKCLVAGCDDYTSKPITRERLTSICLLWLDRPHSAAA